MNREKEKRGAPKNNNCAGKRGCGRKRNQDLGRLTYIQELISKSEVESSTQKATSRNKGSKKTMYQ